MKEYIKYNDREFTISAFKIKTERDLLLTASSDLNENEIDYDIYLRILEPYIICNKNIYELCNDEKLFLIYKLRATSVSNILNINTKCPCETSFKTQIDLNNIINVKKIDKEGLKNIYSNNINDYFIEDANEFDILKYEEFEEYILNNKTTFEFNKKIHCVKCSNELNIDLTSPNIIKNCFSENDIGEFYKGLTRLSFLGKISLGDILNDLYPFERELFITLINNEIQEMNKQAKSKQPN